MSISEIEAAIEQLPQPQLEELAAWFDEFRNRHTRPERMDDWLERARGAAIAGITTAEVMELSRNEE